MTDLHVIDLRVTVKAPTPEAARSIVRYQLERHSKVESLLEWVPTAGLDELEARVRGEAT